MTTEELDDLRTKAVSINGEKWTHALPESTVPSGVMRNRAGYLFSVIAKESVRDIGDYIAAANPEAITRVLDYIEELERALHDLQQDKGTVIESARQQGREEAMDEARAVGRVSDDAAPLILARLPKLAPSKSIMELREEVRRASKPLYIVTAGNQYEGDTQIGSYDTVEEAREVKEKHAHWDWCSIECVQCGEYVPVPEEA
jgi:plasmid stabilization system protein ParE